MKTKEESGFVILVAIGVLMGCLAIVTSLVRYNQANENRGEEFEQAAKIDITYKSMKNQGYQTGESLHYHDKSRLFKNWMLPSFKDIPFSLMLRDNFSGDGDSVEVYDTRKIFFTLASNRYPDGTQLRKMVLRNDISDTETNIDVDMLTGPATSTAVPAGILGAGFFIAVGGELMSITSGSGSSFTVERGTVGGVVTRHLAGESVYAIVRPSGLEGVIKARNKWYTAELTRMSHRSGTPTFSNVRLFNSDTADDLATSLQGGELATGKKGDIVEFYPFNPMGEIPLNWNVNLKYQVVDEQGKINLNTMPTQIADFYFDEGDYTNTIDDLMPLRFNNEILILGDSGDAENTLSGFRKNKDSFTVFTKPNYINGFDSFVYTNTPSAITIDEYLDGSTVDRIVASSDEPIIPHAVNLNTASVNVLSTIYKECGLSVDDAKRLAIATVCYRSGTEYNSLSFNDFDGELLLLDDYQEEYSRSYNPFDGIDDYNGRNYTDGTVENFGSPEEEFLDFLHSSVISLTDDEIDIVMTHVNKDIAQLESEANRSCLMGFEASSVESKRFKISLSIDNQPIFEVDEGSIVEHTKVINDYGDTMDVAAEEAVFYINSQTGWNSNQSIFYGVTAHQPNVSDNLLGDGSVTEYYTDNPFNRSHVYPSLVGKIGSSTFRVISQKTKNTSTKDAFLFDSTYTGTFTTDTPVDFGLRLKGKGEVLEEVTTGTYDASGNHLILNTFTNAATWEAYASSNVGVMLNFNNTPYRVTAINATSRTVYLDPLFNGTPSGAFPLTTFVFGTTYDDTFMAHNSTQQSVASTKNAFYETFVHIPGATFTRVEFDDRVSIEGGASSCIKAELLEIDGTVRGENNNRTDHFITFADYESDVMRLRFTFDDFGDSNLNGETCANNPGNQYPSPQLFEIRVFYESSDDLKDRIVYD